MKRYKYDSIFDFGKYKGKKVIDVYRFHPSYIDWCIRVGNFCIYYEDWEYIKSLAPNIRYKISDEAYKDIQLAEERQLKEVSSNYNKSKMSKSKGIEVLDRYEYRKKFPDYYQSDKENDWETDALFDAFEGDEELYNDWLNG